MCHCTPPVDCPPGELYAVMCFPDGGALAIGAIVLLGLGVGVPLLSRRAWS